MTSSTQAPYPSPCPGGQVSLISLRLLSPPDPLTLGSGGDPIGAVPCFYPGTKGRLYFSCSHKKSTKKNGHKGAFPLVYPPLALWFLLLLARA